MSAISLVIHPKQKDLGDNFVVRRSLPHPEKQMVGPFIFWDHMGPAQVTPEKGMKVRAHPHIGLATITWLFSGEILHRDSLGNEQYIRPGEVNWMTTGNGIVHSERSEPVDESFALEGIQLWLALPKEHEDVDASFYHCKVEDVPQFNHSGCHLSLVAGTLLDKKSPVPVYSQLFYCNGTGEKYKDFEMEVEKQHEAAVYVIKGKIEIESKTYHPYDLICFKPGHPIKFKIIEDAHFMLFGGEIFPEGRIMWWNFVSTSQEKIDLAKKRWREGGHPKVINENEKISLPED